MKIHPEARKHGIAEADIEHTIAHAMWLGDLLELDDLDAAQPPPN